jgi:hypothetical protein
MTDDDESVLEQLSEVVDVVLADDLEPAAPEDPWERRQRILDSWTAIILAVAAVATAWASFQASQWSGVQSDAQSASAIARADAGRSATEATADTIIDSQMWLEWVNAVDSGQKARAAFLDNRFSPALKVAHADWLKGVQLDANGVPVVVPDGTPLTLESYVVAARVDSDAATSTAESLLSDADRASSNSTRFVLLAVLLALVLFFASIAMKFSRPKIQVLLTLLSMLLLVVCLVRVLMLPQSV